MPVEFRKDLFANERDDNLNEIGKNSLNQIQLRTNFLIEFKPCGRTACKTGTTVRLLSSDF